MYKIALCGKSNSGKDTAALSIINSLSHLCDKDHTSYHSFASPIKKIIKIMFPNIPDEHLFGPSHLRNEIISNAKDSDGKPLTIRKALLDIGTGLGRSYLSTIWIDNFLHTYQESVRNNHKLFVVPDLRFYNELVALKDNNFFIIKIIRDSSNLIKHISEVEQDGIPDDKFDFILNNNGTLEELNNIINNSLIPKILSI